MLTHQLFEEGGKVFSLNLLKEPQNRDRQNQHQQQQFMLACGPEGDLRLYEIVLTAHQQHPTEIRLMAKFVLPHSKQRWITDAVLMMSHNNNNRDSMSDAGWWNLVCGDRRGSLHLFDASSKVRIPSI